MRPSRRSFRSERGGSVVVAVAAMPLLDMALSVYQNMSTFDHMGIEAYQPDGRAVSGPARAGVTP